MRNVILSDCDGVLLNWEDSFEDWMSFEKGITRKSWSEFDHYGFAIGKSFGIGDEQAGELIDEFNRSPWMLSLPPVRDAVKFVRKLHEEQGFALHVITSFGDDQNAIAMRMENLEQVFGYGVVQRFVPLVHNVSKEDTLRPYGGRGMIFVEDRKSNVDLAIRLGIEGVLMQHDYNIDYDGAGTRVKNWEEIYKMLVHDEVPSYHRHPSPHYRSRAHG